MNFLIVTEPDDVHAIIVTLVLQSYEHQVVNLFSADFPTRQKNTILIDSQGYRCHTEDDFQLLNHVGYDVVWWRRPRQPKFSKNQLYFELKSVSLFGSEIPASSLPADIQEQIKSKSVRELSIPKGMKVKSVSLSSKGLALKLYGNNIQFGNLGSIFKES